jgi:glycosyl transferase family 9 (putative heptosyltransferase)
MNAMSFIRNASRHVLGRGVQYYRHTGSVPRTILYVAKYAVHKSRRIRARGKAQVAHGTNVHNGEAVIIKGQNNLRLAIRITGGIGDYIVIGRFLRDLIKQVEAFDFDIYCASEGGADWVFRSIPGFQKTYPEFIFGTLAPSYSLALSISQFVFVHDDYAQWKIVREQRRLMRVVHRLRKFKSEFDIMIERHPYMDGFLGQKAVFMNSNRSVFLHAMCGIPYGGHELDLHCNFTFLDRLGLQDREFVTINNGFDPNFLITNPRATKCYPHCDELVQHFKASFPGVRVVQIGTATSIPIKSADVNLIGETTLQEAAGILRRTRLHIDNEGGLVHIARSLGVRSCVIFGPTSLDYFAYADNINIRPTFCGGCWWINSTWMDACPRGFETARCMSTQKPEDIVAGIEAAGFSRAINGAYGPDADARAAPVFAPSLESALLRSSDGMRN